MLRDSDGDIGGGKFTRSGSSALSSYFYLPELLLLASDPLYLFERLERHKLGRGAKKGTAKRDLRATKGDLSWISAGCHYSSRTPPFWSCKRLGGTRRSLRGDRLHKKERGSPFDCTQAISKNQ